MQTRRDQLQAYRFQNRRALAALVTGEPNVVDPPMRRLTAMTLAGVMIAVVVIAIFGILGIVKPTTGDAWKNPGAIIVERETGTTYVRLQDVLHPVLNYSSAVLAVGVKQTPHVELVDRSDIADAKRGATIGIDDVPGTLPPASGLIGAPWSVCSQQHADDTGRPRADVTLYGGSRHGAQPISPATSEIVRGVGDNVRYLLQGGVRYALPSNVVTAALHLDTSSAPVAVGTAFLNALPQGPALQVPSVLGLRRPSVVRAGGVRVPVGRLLHVSDNDTYLLALSDGVSEELNAVQAAILLALPAGPGGQRLSPVTVTESDVLNQPRSAMQWPTVKKELGAVPSTIGETGDDASRAGGMCAIFAKGANTPVLAAPAGSAPSFATGAVTESGQSARGQVDSVVIAPDHAAVVKSTNGAATEFVIANPGKKYAIANTSVLAAFGYAKAKPTMLAPSLLTLVPTGAALDPTSALRPVHG